MRTFYLGNVVGKVLDHGPILNRRLSTDDKIKIIELARAFYPPSLLEDTSKLYIVFAGEIIDSDLVKMANPFMPIEIEERKQPKNLAGLVNSIEFENIDTSIIFCDQEDYSQMLSLTGHKRSHWGEITIHGIDRDFKIYRYLIPMATHSSAPKEPRQQGTQNQQPQLSLLYS